MSYTVQAGDTLFAIAQSHGTTLEQLQGANPGVDPTTLKVGQTLKMPSSGAPSSGGGGYVEYSGPASNFPQESQWASWDELWGQNERLMRLHDSDLEVALIRQAIDTVANESGVDRRVILCIIVQESGGNVRVQTTSNGVRNPGLMQSHNGAEFNPNDPAGSILQMLKWDKYGNYYEAFRGYNSGSVNKRDLNDPVGATGSYVRDAANRLMGHVWNGM
ncbi:intracellular hyphae protein 1 [Diaporthe helianthi]|uniref:Intracellular hyphae protein 1 n=1 Tax=Diaporthe helianthi TaxID=158607 RepID=A0A2P5HMD1_DIAHE|nr:intracellular hyphae protein 1 [Diaporthe helianthi]